MPLPIVDAHHHIWRQADLAWLQGPSVPRIFGDYDAVKRDYPIAEFRAEAEAAGVVRSVYVQTNWPAGGEVDEVAWVEAVADGVGGGWPHGIVSYIDLLSERATDVMAAQARFPRMRGVRQQIHWHERELYRFAQRADVADDPVFQANLARLADHGWHFELQLFTSQFASGARLARAVPQVNLVLQHSGMLEDLSPAGIAAWRSGLARLADCPNVFVKMSGLGTFLHRNDPAHIRFIFDETLEIFGPDRCMWGSNFPIEKLWCDYGALVAAVRAALAERPLEVQRKVLSETALSVYRLPPVAP